MQDYADTIATYNQSIINSAVPQSYWLQVASTEFTQGLLSSPWWSSFCDGTYEKFSHCICIHPVWGLGQKPRLFASTPKVGWPRSHSRHCELELGCDIYRRAGLEQLRHIITQQMSAVVIISFTCTSLPLVAPQSFIGLWTKETGNDLQWHNHFYSVKSEHSPATSFGLLISQFTFSDSWGSAFASVPAGKTTKSTLWSIIQALIQYLKQLECFLFNLFACLFLSLDLDL